MTFCYLENDPKNYDYFMRYAKGVKTRMSFFNIDNQIQIEEIQKHLEDNGYQKNDQQATIKWVQDHAKAFRKYLNTIKIIYLTLACSDKNMHNITLEEFFEQEKKLNNRKAYCLDTIL
jgi:hypothetical protein